MKITVTKTMNTKVEIDVELPFYYVSDYGTYGKVEEKKCTTIQIQQEYGEDKRQYVLSVEHRAAEYYGRYMKDAQHKSDEAEFLEAMEKMLAAVTNARGEQK